MKTTSRKDYPSAIRLTPQPRGRKHAACSLIASRSKRDIGGKVPRFIPGRIGKQVKILCGSAAVTGDESLMSATARKRGKARRVGRPRSQKTCFFALIKSRAVWSGRLSRQGQDGIGVSPASRRPAFVSFTCGKRGLF